jgi:hypothetical protein
MKEMYRLDKTEHFLLVALADSGGATSKLYWYGTGIFSNVFADSTFARLLLGCNSFSQFWNYPSLVHIPAVYDGQLHRWGSDGQKFDYIRDALIPKANALN